MIRYIKLRGLCISWDFFLTSITFVVVVDPAVVIVEKVICYTSNQYNDRVYF